MELIIRTIFWLSGFVIFWGMIGYPLSLKIIDQFYKDKRTKKDYNHLPTVTVIVVAHNEEKVIKDKLQNLLTLDYPEDKIEFIVASDHSTDKTNEIVELFIKEHPEVKVRLLQTKDRKGKTNAQNEAQSIVRTEYLVMTDANSILEKNSIRELMAAFTSDDIAYVSGKLTYINRDSTGVSNVESRYWDSDLTIREIESKVQTITAGNGALYACRNKDYIVVDPIQSHDTSMPLYYALAGKRAIANHDAIAYEKAGESEVDEFKRKVRMNRLIIKHILPDIRILNFIKYRWFSYFYFGHRTCRYLLWISHLILLASNALLLNDSLLYICTFAGQLLFYLVAVLKLATKSNNKLLTLIYYYTLTIGAQWVGVYNILTGKAKPIWEKAESTR